MTRCLRGGRGQRIRIIILQTDCVQPWQNWGWGIIDITNSILAPLENKVWSSSQLVSRGQTLFRAGRYRLHYKRPLILQAITPSAEEGLATRDYFTAASGAPKW